MAKEEFKKSAEGKIESTSVDSELNVPEANVPDVNIDDLEISILMLVKSARNHEAAASFLSRRGWPTKAQSNLQKAIKQIATEKPDFMLVSLNFPHPAIMKLIPLFRQSFGVEIVLFSESQDTATVARLAKLDGPKIAGVPSGPGLQRALRRILQEKFNPSAAAEESEEEKEEELDSTVRIRGGNERQAGNAFVGAPKSEIDTIKTGSYTLESQPLSKKRKKLKDVSTAGIPVQNTVPNGAPSLADLLLQIAESEKNDAPVRSSLSQEEIYAPLHQAVLSGVEDVCDQVFTDWTGIEPTSELYVLPVMDKKLHGYLVVKLDEPVRSARVTFFNMMTGILQDKVKSGSEAVVEDGIEIGIPVINFKNWVDQTAVFKVGSEYFGTKFCVAFLKTDQPLPKLKKMGPEKMIKIAVEEISTQYPVNFKAYIRLEKNKKFFLYLKNGRRLLPEQKERLKENNVSEICVKQIDETNLKKFLAFVQLRESMLEALKIAS